MERLFPTSVVGSLLRPAFVLDLINGRPPLRPPQYEERMQAAVRYGVADALRRVGTRPFFMTVSAFAPPRLRRDRLGGSNAWVVAGRRLCRRMPTWAIATSQRSP